MLVEYFGKKILICREVIMLYCRFLGMYFEVIGLEDSSDCDVLF